MPLSSRHNPFFLLQSCQRIPWRNPVWPLEWHEYFGGTRISLYFLNTNYADNTNIFIWHTDFTDLTNLCSRRGAHRGLEHYIFEHEFLEWHEYSFAHEIRRRPTDRREVIKRMTRIFFCTRISPIARVLVRVGMLTWSLLNENDTNEINRLRHGVLWTHIAFVQFLK